MSTTKRKVSKKRRKRNFGALFLILTLAVLGLFAAYCLNHRELVAKYEHDLYSTHIYQSTLQVDDLCVATDDVESDDFHTTDELLAAALFQIDEADVLYASNIHEKVYPASTTKILTAYLAIKYGNL